MKKTIFSLFALAILFSSFTTKQGFVIEGTMSSDKYNGRKVYLQRLDDDNKAVKLDSAVVRNSSFMFKGDVADVALVRMVALDKPGIRAYRPALVFVESGVNTLALDSLLTPTVGGTTLNNKYQKSVSDLKLIQAEMANLMTEYNNLKKEDKLTPEAEKRIDGEYEQIDNKMRDTQFSFLKENMENPMGEFIFTSYYSRLKDSHIQELLDKSSSAFKTSGRGQKIIKHYAVLEATQIGKPFIDVKSLSPEGKEIALSDYAGKGKVVLVDFWASWCGPCRKEMPSVVAAYEKYKDKGLEIFGISLDSDDKSWKKALETMNMTWPQISDLKGWKSEPAAEYAVKSIPATYLLDKDGKIIAKNLRGEELIKKIGELLD